MRLLALAAAALVLVACSNSTGPTASSTRTSGGPAVVNAAATKAADLRVRLDLLLAEQVMIIAKETEAAVNRSDEYGGYTNLLTTNANDLEGLMQSAFGHTAASQLWQAWGSEDSYLVAYAIGVVTHNQSKADSAISGVQADFVPHFAQLIASLTRLPQDQISQLMSQQVLETKLLIDDESAQRFAAAYADLHTVYAQTRRMGDAVASGIVQQFPDKFPGDPTVKQVDSRVTLNLQFQESAYLSTMASDSIAGGRVLEGAAATNALATSANSIGTAIAAVLGTSAATRFDRVWASRDASVAAYAAGTDANARSALTQSFVSDFCGLANLPTGQVTDQVDAMLRAIDDQRGKTLTPLPGDDRAAATAMQPIADAISAQG